MSLRVCVSKHWKVWIAFDTMERANELTSKRNWNTRDWIFCMARRELSRIKDEGVAKRKKQQHRLRWRNKKNFYRKIPQCIRIHTRLRDKDEAIWVENEYYVAPLAVGLVLSPHLLCSHSIIDTPFANATHHWYHIDVGYSYCCCCRTHASFCGFFSQNCSLIWELCVSHSTLLPTTVSQDRQLSMPKTHGTISSLHCVYLYRRQLSAYTSKELKNKNIYICVFKRSVRMPDKKNEGGTHLLHAFHFKMF